MFFCFDALYFCRILIALYCAFPVYKKTYINFLRRYWLNTYYYWALCIWLWTYMV